MNFGMWLSIEPAALALLLGVIGAPVVVVVVRRFKFGQRR